MAQDTTLLNQEGKESAKAVNSVAICNQLPVMSEQCSQLQKLQIKFIFTKSAIGADISMWQGIHTQVNNNYPL